MSRILPGTMPAKKIAGDYKTRLPQMLRETCVAELTHWLLCVAGLHCLTLWPSVGGLGSGVPEHPGEPALHPDSAV